MRGAYLILTVVLGTGLTPHLQGQSADTTVTHQQIIPSGWSAINMNLFTERNQLPGLFPNPPEGFLLFKWVGDWDIYQFQFGQWDSDEPLLPGESGLVMNPGQPFEIEWQGEVVKSGPYSGFLSAATAISEEALENVGAGTTVFEYLPAVDAENPLFETQWPDEKSMTFEENWTPEAPVLNAVDSPGIFFVANPESAPHLPVIGRSVGRDVYVNNYVPALGVNAPIGHGACEFVGGDFESMQATGDVLGVHAMQVEIASEEISVFVPVFRSGTGAGYFDVRGGATLSLESSDLLKIPAFFSAADGLTIRRPSTGSAPRPPTVLTALQPEFVLKPTQGPYCGLDISFSPGPEIVTGAKGKSLRLPINLCSFKQPAAAQYWNYYQLNVPRLLERQLADGSWLEIARTRDNLYFQFDSLQPADQGHYRFRAFDELISPTCGFTARETQIISEVFQIAVDSSPPIADAGSDVFIVDRDGNGFAQGVLNASGSRDPDGEITQWRWQWDEEEHSGAILERRFPLGETRIQLTVRDDSGAEHTDDVLVTVYTPSSVDSVPLNVIGFRDRVGEVLEMNLTGITRGNIWGTDVYADHSTLGLAAVHSGILEEGESRTVYVLIETGADEYVGSNQNRIESTNLGSWGGSFRFISPEVTPKPITVTRILPAQPPRINEVFKVELEIDPGDHRGSFSFNEVIGNFHTVLAASDGGTFDGTGVSWSPLDQSERFRLSYYVKLTDPDARAGSAFIAGLARSGELSWQVQGDPLLLPISEAPPVGPARLTRDIVSTAQADTFVTVELSAEFDSYLRLGTVSEQLPEKVTLVEVFGEGVYNPDSRTVTWQGQKDSTSFRYRFRVDPSDSSSEVEFVGRAQLLLPDGFLAENIIASNLVTLLGDINEGGVIVGINPVSAFYRGFGQETNQPVDEAFIAQLYVQQQDGSFAAVGDKVTPILGRLPFAQVTVESDSIAHPLTGKIVGWLSQFGDNPDHAWTGVVESEPQVLPHVTVGEAQQGPIPRSTFEPLILDLPVCGNGWAGFVDPMFADHDTFSEGDLMQTTIAVAGQNAILTVLIADPCGHDGVFQWSREGALLGRAGVARHTDPFLGNFYTTAVWALPSVKISDAGAYDIEHLAYGGSNQAHLVVLERAPYRRLPEQPEINSSFEVSVTIPPFQGAEALTITETLPEGVSLVDSTGGMFEEETRSITWTASQSEVDQVIRYTLSSSVSPEDVRIQGLVGSVSVPGVRIVGDERFRNVVPPLNITRVFPASFPRVNQSFTVELEVNPGSNTEDFWVEESIWPLDKLQITNPSHGGIVNLKEQTIRWGPFSTTEPFVLKYQGRFIGTILPGQVADFESNATIGEKNVAISRGELVVSPDPSDAAPKLTLHLEPTAVLDDQVTVELHVEPPNDLSTVSVVASLPTEASYVEGTGGVYDSENHSVTWFPETDTGSQLSYQVHLDSIEEDRLAVFDARADFQDGDAGSRETLLASESVRLFSYPVAELGPDISIVDIDGDGFAHATIRAGASEERDPHVRGWHWQWADQEQYWWADQEPTGNILDFAFPVGQTQVKLAVIDFDWIRHTGEMVVSVYSSSRLDDAPLNLIGFRDQVGKSLEMTLMGSSSGSVWGTHLYADHSSLGAAAVHAGVLKEGESGTVHVLIESGADEYSASSQNGIQSLELDSWEGSFRFVSAEFKSAPLSVRRILPPLSPRINEVFTVELEVDPGTQTDYWIDELIINTHATLAASHEGVVDPSGLGLGVHWGPLNHTEPFRLSYQMMLLDPSDRGATVLFDGSAKSARNEWQILGSAEQTISGELPIELPELNRTINSVAHAEEIVTVKLSIDIAPSFRLGTVSEQLPEEVSLIEVFNEGEYNEETHTLTWQTGSITQRSFSYQLRVKSVVSPRKVEFIGTAEVLSSAEVFIRTLSNTNEVTLLAATEEGSKIVFIDPVAVFYLDSRDPDWPTLRPGDEAFVAQLFILEADGSYVGVGETISASGGTLNFLPIAVDTSRFHDPLQGKLVGWFGEPINDPEHIWRGVIESETMELPHVVSGQDPLGPISSATFEPISVPLYTHTSACSDGELSFDVGESARTTLALAGQDAVLAVSVSDPCGTGGWFEWSGNGKLLGRAGSSRTAAPDNGDFSSEALWAVTAVQMSDAGVYDIGLLGYEAQDQTRLVVLEREPHRMLPDEIETESPFDVILTIPPFQGVEALTIREFLPTGVALVDRAEAAFEEETRALTWTISPADADQIIQYKLSVSVPDQELQINGIVRTDDSEGIAVGGANRLFLAEPPSLEIPEPCVGDGGLVSFLNPRGPVIDLNGDPASLDVMGQLFVGLTESTLEPICTPIPVLLSGVFNGGEQPVPGTEGGEVVFVQLRAWKGTDDFESALVRGVSEIQTVSLKKPGDLIPAPILSTASFQLIEVPQEAVFQPLVREGTAITLRWTGRGKLQEAPALDGPYMDAPNQANPQTIEMDQVEHRFFRIVKE